MTGPFRWNAHNIEHIAEHGVTAEEAESVICDARSPFPRMIGNDKSLVWGQTENGDYLQVIFIYSPPGTIYVIHARPMTDKEKSRLRQRRRYPCESVLKK